MIADKTLPLMTLMTLIGKEQERIYRNGRKGRNGIENEKQNTVSPGKTLITHIRPRACGMWR
jgi:hypothetical protein